MKKLITISAFLFAIPCVSQANPSIKMGYMEQAVTGLPHDKAENFLAMMQEAHDTNKDLYDQAHKLREDMHHILIAPTFDKDAFASKSQELRHVRDEINSNMDDAFINAAADLSPGERKKLAAGLERTHKEEKRALKKASAGTQQ